MTENVTLRERKETYNCLLSYSENCYLLLLLVTRSKPIHLFQIAVLKHCTVISP